MGRDDRDVLGSRMKNNYEFRARTMLPRRTFTCVRLDGKNFSAYTRNLERPFDMRFVQDMAATALFLCQQVQNCRLGYVQSDEISLVLADNATPTTEAWFDGNQQKIVSITASMATAKFNELRPGKLAFFDSRAFTIPDVQEVANYLVWRQQDATRNSVSMAAQSKFSHKQLHKVNCKQMQEMLWSEHRINWDHYAVPLKRGTVIVPGTRREDVSYTDKRTGVTHVQEGVTRRVWVAMEPPVFTADRDWLLKEIEGAAE